jgi:hypothetical protein
VFFTAAGRNETTGERLALITTAYVSPHFRVCYVYFRSLQWVLERSKELTPKGTTIREKFNIYHFAEYKEILIGLMQRVYTFDVEMVKTVREMADNRVID